LFPKEQLKKINPKNLEQFFPRKQGDIDIYQEKEKNSK